MKIGVMDIGSDSIKMIIANTNKGLIIEKKLKEAVPALSAGEPLTESLTKTGVVLPMVLDMMAIGDKTGSPDAVLQKVSDYMDAEVDSTISKLSVVLFVVMILAVGIMVAMDAISTIGDYSGKLGGAGG